MTIFPLLLLVAFTTACTTVQAVIVYYCVLLNIALFLSVGLLRPQVSGMTPWWPFNPHYGELSYVFMLLLLMWIDELNK